jgi:hypothetical protein
VIWLWSFFLAATQIIGPGAISYAGPGTLERVAERRLKNGWGLTEDWRNYPALVAPADCALLGRSGWLVVEGTTTEVLAVDCEQAAHQGQMAARGIIADVSVEELARQQGWLVLK